jgi:hypothetical protein
MKPHRKSPSRRASAVVIALLVAAGCETPQSTAGHPCPCAAGDVCCNAVCATGTCTGGDAATDSAADAEFVCGPDEKRCTNAQTGAQYCSSKLDPVTGCLDGMLGAMCLPCAVQVQHATTLCTPDFKCAIAACDTGWIDCNPIGVTGGCSTNINTDPRNCGACANLCRLGATVVNASPACFAGHCTLVCDPGAADCDGIPANGCECIGSCDPMTHTCVAADGGVASDGGAGTD